MKKQTKFYLYLAAILGALFFALLATVNGRYVTALGFIGVAFWVMNIKDCKDTLETAHEK